MRDRTAGQLVRPRERDQYTEGLFQSGGRHQRLQADFETRGSRPADSWCLHVAEGRRRGRGEHRDVKISLRVVESPSGQVWLSLARVTEDEQRQDTTGGSRTDVSRWERCSPRLIDDPDIYIVHIINREVIVQSQ